MQQTTQQRLGPYGENRDIWYFHVRVYASYFVHNSGDFATYEDACAAAMQLRDVSVQFRTVVLKSRRDT